MWKSLTAVVLALLAWGVLTATASAQGEPLRLEGYVKDGNSNPLPAITVYLVHPTMGRSQPRLTDQNGYFCFDDVPRVSDSYYLEVYWGRTLMYRQSARVDGTVRWPDIILN